MKAAIHENVVVTEQKRGGGFTLPDICRTHDGTVTETMRENCLQQVARESASL